MCCRLVALAVAVASGSLIPAFVPATALCAATAGVASPSPSPSAYPSPSASPASAAGDLSNEDMQDASELVDPLAPKGAFTIEDENTQSVAGPNNQINLVGQVPLGINPPFADLLAHGHALSLLRIKLPIVTTSPTIAGVDAVTGTGDLSVTWLAGFGSAASRWAAGAILKFPTGSGALGSGKWSAGPALGYTHQQHQLTNLPVGLRVAKRYKIGTQRASTFVGLERNLAAVGGTSVTVRFGTRLVFGP